MASITAGVSNSRMPSSCVGEPRSFSMFSSVVGEGKKRVYQSRDFATQCDRHATNRNIDNFDLDVGDSSQCIELTNRNNDHSG